MLNITVQQSAQAAKSYFAHSDYYMADTQEIIGHWGGKGAELLGLSGQMTKPAFDRLCDNLDPNTGKPLTALTRDNRRVGYDFTFSVPKSVSLMHALTDDERIETALRQSIKDTMQEIEAEVQCRVRKNGANTDRSTGNIVYSEFIHLTSRPVNGVPDPQLHAHVFAFNATFDPVEDRWKAAQFGAIKSNGFYWQAVQQARFATRLQELGYSIRKTKDAFEIDGVPPSTLPKFSRRTAVIEQTAKDQGITDPKIKATLGATTREAKNHEFLYSELKELWDKRLTPDERQALLDVADAPKPSAVIPRDAEHVKFAAEHLFERASVVDERRLLTTALRHGIGEVTPEGVRAEISRLELLKREDRGKVLVTTQETLDLERRMIGYATQSKGSCRPLVTDDTITFSDHELDAEQRAAVELPLRSADRIMIIRGIAGTGKTRSVTEAVNQLTTRGREVVLVAPTVRAVGVLKDNGFKDAATLAKLEGDATMQARARNGFVILDEASMVGTKAMNGLFNLAKTINARIILLGDKKQLPSVEAGSPLRMLEDLAGLKVAELSTIRRQSGEYREAVKLLARGHTGEGLKKLDGMGCVKVLPVWDTYKPVAQDYANRVAEAVKFGRDQEDEALIICPTHAEGQKVQDAVRSELKLRLLLAPEDRTFTRLVPLQWTEAERADSARYSGEEVILQFHRNCGPFTAGQRVKSGDAMDNLAKLRPANFATYGQSTIALAAGDLIRATAKGKSLDGKHTLTNGSIHRVKGFDRRGDIVLANGWIVGKDFGHFVHSYVNTSYAAQGRTVQHSIVVQSTMSYPASSRESFYVAASRGRKSISIYTDDKRQLREAVQRDIPRVSAMELMQKPKVKWWNRMREVMARTRTATLLAAKAAQQHQQQEHAYAR